MFSLPKIMKPKKQITQFHPAALQYSFFQPIDFLTLYELSGRLSK